MLFNSYAFLCFFPLALLLYWGSRRSLKLQNAVLVALSYVFYAWWDLRFLALIVGMTAVGFLSALAIGPTTSHSPQRRRLTFLTGTGICLGTLALFKYYDFFIGECNALLAALGTSHPFPLLHLLLPVGISFYTFQIVSYMADVYRGRMDACRDAVAFAAFVSFFPQLVAGPIERASDLLPQMQRPRTASYADFVNGFRLMLWGFVKKMLLADRCAPLGDMVFSDPSATGPQLWTAALLFAFQIYGDFSGYSDIAIGAARMFGIRLTRNFHLPYFSRSVPEFWRRWHISLMTWLKDYVYIPLGGSRCSHACHMRNIALVFLISGIWHGANWTFIAWGLFQLIGFIPQFLPPRKTVPAPSEASVNAPQSNLSRWFPTGKEAVQMVATFAFVCIGWVLFRSDTLGEATAHIGKMLTELPFAKPFCGWAAFLPILLVLTTEWVTRHRNHPLDFSGNGLLRFRGMRWMIYYTLILSTLYWGGQQSAFIYFQF